MAVRQPCRIIVSKLVNFRSKFSKCHTPAARKLRRVNLELQTLTRSWLDLDGDLQLPVGTALFDPELLAF